MSPSHFPPVAKVTLLAVALLSASHAAQAQSQSSISINNFQYTLIDLDPNDGIAPSLIWNSATSTSYVGVSAQTGRQDPYLQTPLFKGIVNETDTLPGSIGGVTAASGQNHAASTGPTTLTVSAATPLGQYWYDVAQFTGSFTLTPQTAVTFSAQAQGSVVGTVPADAFLVFGPNGYVSNGYFDWAYIQADASATIELQNAAGALVGTYERLDIWVRSNQSSSKSAEKTIFATLANDTALSTPIKFTASAALDGYTVAPIPEPATWAQMVLGLAGLVGLGARRRHASARI